MSSRYDPRAHGAQCDICPLKTCKPVAPESDQMSNLARLGGVGVAVVSNSPGEQEERQGRAFVGQVGDELNKALRSAGIQRSNVHFTYALLCRPPGDKLSEFIRRINQQNRENQKLAKAAGREAPVPVPSPLDCCAPRLEQEIEPFENFITLGGTAFTAVTGSTASVMAVRGGLTALDATIRTPARQVMPTLHPTLVRKQQRWAHVFRNDIAKAGRWFRGQSKWIPPHVIYHPSPDVLRQFLSDRTRIYTFDLETDGVESLTAKIRCVGIGFEDVGVLCGILGKDGFTKFYPPDVEVEIIQILSEFFADPGIVKAGHNAGYYDKIVLQQQWGITTTPIIDTMLLHRSVESELPHGLAYVGSMYTEAPSWKTDRSGNKLSYGSETDEELHEYCLFEGTRIVLANGSTEAIETIVRQKQKVEVLSMDAQGSLVPGAIVDWKYATEEAIDWWVIQVKGQRSKDRGLVLTADHQVCVENKGWVEAQKVNIGDRLYDAEPAFTYDELAALCGTLLGDSTLGVAPDCRTAGISGARSAYLQGGHSTASGFASWKEKELWFIRTGPELPGKDVEVEGRAGVSGPFTPLKSKNYRQLADLGAKIYDERNRHRLRVSTLDFMGLRGLAWLYVDDGCLQRMPGDRQDTMVFSTQRYLREDIDAAVAWFREKWGAASAGTDGVLRVGAVASRKLAQAIAPYLPEEARYKLPSIEGVDWAAVPYYPVQGGSESQASTREVISVGPYVPDTATRQGSYRAKRRYCLTVEGTQCFFTNYGLVHNCGNDVAVTARVLPPLVDQVGLRGQIPVWQLDQKMQSIYADMHTAGMCVDQTVRLSEEKRLLTRRFELLQDIRDRLGIPTFNPGSVYQVRDILFEKWQLTPPLEDDDRFTSSGDPSTADLVLRSLLTDRAVDKDQRSLIKLLRYYRKVQKVLGTYVVKLRPWNMKVDDDLGWDDDEEWSDKEARKKYGIEKRGIVNPRTGRMHPGYNAHVAVTGRLSSSKPINAQNFPKEMRAMIIPAPGHVLVGADMDQLELRIAAARWGVALYLRAFEDGKDPHSMTAFAVFGDAFLAATGLTADQFRQAGKLVSPSYADGKFIGTGEDKKMRDLSKAVQYASQYMAKAETVHKLICKTEVPARGSDGKLLNDGTTDLPYALLPFKRVREMRDNWLKGAPEFASGWEQEIQAYRDTGYIREDVTGRRRDFLDGEAPNEIVNFPIQCVPGNTRVLTEFGYVPIRELQGRTFRAWTGKRWASATCIEKGKAKLKEVRTDHAVRLVCDNTHRFKVPQRSAYAWVEAAALAPGSRVAMDLARPLPFGFRLPADDAYMLGLYVGDGCLSRKDKGRGRSVALSFTIGKTSETGDPGRAGEEAVDRAVDYCLARGLHPRTQEHEGHWVVQCTNEVTYWAEAWGLNPGLSARDKRIPESIWRADLDARKAFLRGLLDADGYQCPDGAVHLNLCNPDLLEEVAILSRTAGVDALSLSGPHKTNKEGQHTSWRLVLAGAHAHKQLGWGRACKYRSNYTIPQFECARIVERLKPATPSHRTMKSRIRGHGGSKSITPYSAVEMGVHDLYDHGVVTGVLDLDIEVPVYTLVVDDPDHQYVANGFIAKNSSAAGLMNRAIVQLHEAIPLHKWGPGTGIINQCHDSIVVECPEAEAPKVIGLLEECLNQTHASLPGVIFSASAETGMTWKAVG